MFNYNTLIYIFMGLSAIMFLAALYVFVKYKKNNDPTGIIFVERTEDGERDRIRFVLDIDLDEIKQKKLIIFEVKDTTGSASQN